MIQLSSALWDRIPKPNTPAQIASSAAGGYIGGEMGGLWGYLHAPQMIYKASYTVCNLTQVNQGLLGKGASYLFASRCVNYASPKVIQSCVAVGGLAGIITACAVCKAVEYSIYQAMSLYQKMAWLKELKIGEGECKADKAALKIDSIAPFHINWKTRDIELASSNACVAASA